MASEAEKIARTAIHTQHGWMVAIPCHEWRGPRMGEKSGYRCVECGSQVEKASEMMTAPKCRPRLCPISWLPAKIGSDVAAILSEQSQ